MTISTTLAGELRGVSQTPIIDLVTITHSIYPQIVRLANSPVDVVVNGFTFEAYKLKVVTPKQGRDIDTDIQIALANIDPTKLAQWFQRMPRTEAPLFTVFRVRALSPDMVEERFDDCPLVSLQGEDTVLNCICRWETVLNQPLSVQKTRGKFPGLYRDA